LWTTPPPQGQHTILQGKHTPVDASSIQLFYIARALGRSLLRTMFGIVWCLLLSGGGAHAVLSWSTLPQHACNNGNSPLFSKMVTSDEQCQKICAAAKDCVQWQMQHGLQARSCWGYSAKSDVAHNAGFDCGCLGECPGSINCNPERDILAAPAGGPVTRDPGFPKDPTPLVLLPQDMGDESPAALDGSPFGVYFSPSKSGSTKDH
jgi:hypothetical protein